jgi:hypothetical protein
MVGSLCMIPFVHFCKQDIFVEDKGVLCKACIHACVLAIRSLPRSKMSHTILLPQRKQALQRQSPDM